MYVVPQAIGATAVTSNVFSEVASMETNVPSLEDIVNAMSEEQPDAVDRIAEQWARERPDLDVGPMLVVGRLHRAADLLDQELRTVFARAGLGNGDFDVLASLRRAGAPYKLTPTELAGTTMVTSGAVTKRVDRLVKDGLVERSVSETDGRGRVIALTAKGKRVQEELHPQHLANEERLISALDADEQRQLAGLLSKLLLSLED